MYGGNFLKVQKKLLTLVSALLFCFSLTACNFPGEAFREESAGDEDGILQDEEDMETLQEELEGFMGEDAYKQSFVKPQVDNHIYIDSQGYDTQENKQAYFVGEELAGEFSVYKKDDGSLGYTGRLTETDADPLQDLSVYRGDFSEVTEPGTYYVQMAVIGRSYDFVIEENHYDRLRGELLQSFLETQPETYFDNGDSEGMEDGLYAFLQMCISCQLSEVPPDREMSQKLCDNAAWLITWKEETDRQKEVLFSQEYYLISTCLSQFACVIQQTDAQLSQQCLQASRRAYQQAAGLTGTQGDDETSQYMAAASLYKASGNAAYHNIVKTGYQNLRKQTLAADDNSISANDVPAAETASVNTPESMREEIEQEYRQFLAAFFYLTTERTVDALVCEQMMSDFMAECAQYLNDASGAAFGLTTGSRWLQSAAEPEQMDAQREEWEQLRQRIILRHGIRLAIADYTIVGQEYRNVCRQQLHYLLHDAAITDMQMESQSAAWLILNIITGSEEA